ncbi:MAG: ATP-grasp domain-containing protein [Geminicoccaceae bacterium]
MRTERASEDALWPSAIGVRAEAFDEAASLEAFLAFGLRKMLPVQDRALIRTAEARGIPATRLAGRTIMLGQGRLQQRLSATKTTHTNVVSNDLAANKDYTRRVLGDLGLPVPRYARVRTRKDAVEAARSIGYPVVVKPNNGSMGKGVSVGMKGRHNVRSAFKRAHRQGRSVLIEEMVEGADYRLLVINGKFCAASKRVPGHVVGDGKNTIEDLVAEVNKDPRRGKGPTTSWTIIELDTQADRLIAELGYTRQSVPAAGEVIYLRRNANTSDGGTAADVTDDVHPDNRDIAVLAAKAVGLDIAGVDFLTRDISTSMWENGGKICEINSRPGIRKHIWPAEGKPRDVLNPIVDMLFPKDQPSRVPIVAVMGNGDTETTARMLAHVLTAGGRHVGLAVQQRVYSGDRSTARGPLTVPEAARRILLDPDVDVAILELDAAAVLSQGLGCDVIDAVVVVNADQDEIKESGDARSELQAFERAFGIVVSAVRGAILVDNADGCATRLEDDGVGDKLCRIATGPDDWAVTKPGSAHAAHAVREGSAICVYDQNGPCGRIPMVETREQALGDDTQRMVRSVMYASVAAYNLGEDPGSIYRSLSSYCEAARKPKEQAGRKEAAIHPPPKAGSGFSALESAVGAAIGRFVPRRLLRS